ncbi:hypothetical protein SEVIR_9G535600v4 [Setaria viridis]|uniref:Uncharacterized protein n=1 Tax=Setaria viridis TaxID=4556 RepID=A0A4U6TBY0_SETVI|nr:hypothetical protein SEVIR_9G535600v2 [Setaria viridis]
MRDAQRPQFAGGRAEVKSSLVPWPPSTRRRLHLAVRLPMPRPRFTHATTSASPLTATARPSSPSPSLPIARRRIATCSARPYRGPCRDRARRSRRCRRASARSGRPLLARAVSARQRTAALPRPYLPKPLPQASLSRCSFSHERASSCGQAISGPLLLPCSSRASRPAPLSQAPSPSLISSTKQLLPSSMLHELAA